MALTFFYLSWLKHCCNYIIFVWSFLDKEIFDIVNSLLEQIPSMFGETRETETVLGPVIQAGTEALKVNFL